ncbi:hypothetical protein AB0M46_16750, partial [Dactylosporangium sp. NPDC051485]|uniref:hypothetical protein n=1 Tax=Dactylosporangium sp. NPDC051485 TaxID=3154846 RepID=UPI00342440E0
EDARQAVEGLQAAARRGELEAVRAAAGPLHGALEAAERGLDDLCDRIVERREVLQSIVAALPGTGFQVDPASYREGADGALELRAYGHAGQAFAVLVRDNPDARTEVLYTTDAMAGEVAAGEPGRSCAPLLDIIERLSEETRGDGFEPGAVRWDDADDPDRPPPAGRAVPPGQQGHTGQQGRTARGAA